jgi:hypothetical protein
MMIEQGHGETIQENVDVIVKLSTATTTATASNRGTVATLMATNDELAANLRPWKHTSRR